MCVTGMPERTFQLCDPGVPAGTRGLGRVEKVGLPRPTAQMRQVHW